MKVTPTPGSVSGRRIDRVGDPLEGLVNLFDLALVLAVGLLLAALSSTGLLPVIAGSGGGGTPIPNQPSGSSQTQGQGQEVGKVYRLQDGTYVFSPSGKPLGNQNGGGSTAGTTTVPPQGATGGTSTPQQSLPQDGATGAAGGTAPGF